MQKQKLQRSKRMKELNYEDWQKNPTPRMMWVWDDEKEKVKRKVIYILSGVRGRKQNVITLYTDESCTYAYAHCAEIEEPKIRRMTNQELAWWLSEKPHRELKIDNYIYHDYDYEENVQDVEVTDFLLIREDGRKWREPLVETDEYKDYLESEKAYNDGV